MNFDNLEDKYLLDIGNETHPKECKAKLQFRSVNKADCNIILVLPKSFKEKLGQQFQLARNVEDTSESIVKVSEK